ncbi:SRPBCC family protein [Chryseobacterium sp. CT-SW4]|uniref:SRPBCC family protein n=1 Tax=Chryseobacterium sp. SW-1 TaxID=3157343 RepID=UPI003B028AEC
MNNPIIIEYVINTPVHRAWRALTDKNEMKRWYFDIPDFEPKEGHIFNFYESGDSKKYHHQGEILEMIPDQKLKYTWTYPDFTKEKTIVSWELKPEDGGTKLILTHENIESFKNLGENFSRENFIEGWNMIIRKNLKSYLENE